MSALKRESSFERVLSHMSGYSRELEQEGALHGASHLLSRWVKKTHKMRDLLRVVRSADSSVIFAVLRQVQLLSHDQFQRAQEVVSGEEFVKALSQFLHSLPSDPSLKKKNKMARSVRFITSSILIAKFPGLVLENDGHPDTGHEASQCHLGAKLYLFSLRRLFRVSRSFTSLHEFRQSLVGYRYSLRYFLDAIETWKKVDCERIKHSFESAYCEAFMAIWSSKKTLEEIDEKLKTVSGEERQLLVQEKQKCLSLVESGNTKLVQYRDMLVQLLGSRQSKDVLEELDAYLQSSTDFAESSTGEEVGSFKSDAVTETENGVSAVLQNSSKSLSEDNSALSSEEIQLRRVAAMTGLDENNILYELCLDPRFQVPDHLPELRPFSSERDCFHILPSQALTQANIAAMMQTDPSAGRQELKKIMIRSIEDRFVANMMKSKIDSTTEICVGSVYPIWYGDESHGSFMFGEVLEVDFESSLMSCKYLVDDTTVKNVPISHVKLSSKRRDPISSGFFSLLKDVVSKISMLIPSRGDLHSKLSSAFDFDLLKQMVENDAMGTADMMKLLSTLFEFVTSLQSPHRSSQFTTWYAQYSAHCMSLDKFDDVLPFVPKFFEVISERIEQLHLEIANYFLSQLAPYASKEGPKILCESIVSKIEKLPFKEEADIGSDNSDVKYVEYLPQTTSFLCDQLNGENFGDIVGYLREMGILDSEASTENTSLLSLDVEGNNGAFIVRALLARAFSLLLQKNVDFGSPQGFNILPETLIWDGKRLRNLKNEIDSLVLVSSLLISTKSFLLPSKIRLSSEQEYKLQDMLYEVMRDDSVSLTAVVTTAQGFVKTNFAPALPIGWENSLEETLKKCIAPTSPVFVLFAKRVHSVFLRALLDVPFTDILARYSMTSRSQVQQLKVIISLSKALYSHSVNAFLPVYSAICRAYIRSISSK